MELDFSSQPAGGDFNFSNKFLPDIKKFINSNSPASFFNSGMSYFNADPEKCGDILKNTSF